MTEEDAAVLRQTLIRESVGLAALGLMLWYFGPGRTWINGLAHRARTMMGTRQAGIDAEIAWFRAQVSRWDHEQAAQQD